MSEIPSTPPLAEDVSGRSRFTRNVAFTWGAYGVYVIAGFVLPRLISDHLGRTGLGMWDFAWSVVGYFGMIELGIGCSIDRYVARHRATGDGPGLVRSVSSLSLCLAVIGGVVLVVTLATVWQIVPLFGAKFGQGIRDVQWIVFFLGTSMAAQIALNIYSGVLIGVHRWDIYNVMNSGFYALSSAGMAVALLLGAGLPTCAALHGLGTVACELARIRVAHRHCPGLRIDWREARWSVILEQARYSSKILVPRFAELLINETTSVMIVLFLGSPALAVFSRPRALVRHVRTLVAKYAHILVPSASSLHARNDHGALREMLCSKSYYGACLAMPAVIAISILGDPIVRLWMGHQYVVPWLVPTLALGYLVTMNQEPVWAVLAGMNRHGPAALTKLAGAVAAALLVVIVLTASDGSLVGVALALITPLLVVDGVWVPVYACRSLGISLAHYYHVSLLKPLLQCLPFGVCLGLARFLWSDRPFVALAVGGAAGGLVLAVTYSRYVVPPALKQKIREKLPAWLGLSKVVPDGQAR